jgi:hypothetical protein
MDRRHLNDHPQQTKSFRVDKSASPVNRERIPRGNQLALKFGASQFYPSTEATTIRISSSQRYVRSQSPDTAKKGRLTKVRAAEANIGRPIASAF